MFRFRAFFLGLVALALGVSPNHLMAQAFRGSPDHTVRWWECGGMSGNWGGLRTCLEEHGVCIDSTFTEDLSYNASHGVDVGGTQRFLFDLNATVDLECLLGWCGASVYIDAYLQRGNDGSEKTGDLQAYSNVDLQDLEQISEFWFEQTFCDRLFRVKVGKVDANSEFAYTENGGEFINSSMGFTPTLFVFPSYPDPATSLNVFICPGHGIFAGAAIYDGSTQKGRRTGSRALRNPFKDPYFAIGELGACWESFCDCLSGRATVGAWYHSGTFDRFDGGVDDGTAGVYFTFDHDLWLKPSEDPCDCCDLCCQRMAVFFQYGYANPAVSEVGHHMAAGWIWEGAFTGRVSDVLGFGVTHVQVSDALGAGFTKGGETAFELFYRWEVLCCLSIKPDIQYIRNPGAMADVGDALVGTVRVEVSL